VATPKPSLNRVDDASVHVGLDWCQASSFFQVCSSFLPEGFAMNLSVLFGSKQPRANKFRVGDTWRGPEGRSYVVKEAHDDGHVVLNPIGWNIPLCLAVTAVQGFARIHWGGQD
jgi:hypothetical protein